MAQDFDVGAAGDCPDIGAMAQANDGRALPTAESMREISSRQYIAFVPELRLTQTSDLFDPINATALAFGDRLEALAQSSVDRRVVLLRSRATFQRGELCGWADLSDLYNLAELTPLLLRDLPGRQDSMGIDGTTASTLTAQSVARASRDAEGRLIPVPVFSVPNSLSDDDGAFVFRLARPLSYFSVTSVLDVRFDQSPEIGGDRPTNGACFDVSDPECFLLLGGVNENGREDIVGWVRGSDVDPWPSTLSLFYSEGAKNVTAYFSQCAALRQILGDVGLCTDNGTLTGGYAEAEGTNLPRYPIVGVERIPNPATGRDVFVYEAIAPVGVCLEGSQRDECRDANAALSASAETQLRLDLLRNVDILFVIDGSASMERFFEPALDAATAFADRVVASGAISPRFAAVVYSDYRGATGTVEEVELMRLADFGLPGDTSNLAGLQAADAIQSRLGDVHRDQPEAPFAAMSRAVDPSQTAWRPDAGIRLVIWIADVGNRDLGTTQTDGGFSLNETVGVQTVAAAAAAAPQQGPSNIIFSAVHVPSRDADDIAPNRADFLGDYEALANALPPQSVFAPMVLQSASEAEARSQIFNALDQILTAVAEAERCADGDPDCAAHMPPAAARGAGGADGSQTDLFALSVGRGLAEQLGLVRSGGSGELAEGELIAVERVFIPYDPADGDFDFWLGLRPREMTDLVQAVGNVCEEMNRRQFGPQLLEGYLNVLETVTRANIDRNMTVSQFLATVLSVPQEEFSSLVTADVPFISLLDQLAGDDSMAASFHGEMCRHATMLSFVNTGFRTAFDDILWDGTRASLRNGVRTESFNWDWSGEGGGNRYFFFPLEFLP